MRKEMSLSSNSYKWMILFLATGTQASSTLITYGVGPLSYFWKQEYNLTQMETGILLSAVSIGPLFFMLFVGGLLDRYNERLLIGAGSICLGLSILSVNVSGGFIGLFFTLSLAGIFYSTALPGGSKVIMKWFPENLRGLAIGIRQTGIPIGGAVAGMIIPIVSMKYGWPTAVYILSAICILGGLLFIIFYKEPPFHEEVSVTKSQVKTLREQIQEIIKNRNLYPVLLIGICMMSLQMVIIGHYTVFLTDRQSLSPLLAGQIFSVVLFSGVLGRIILAFISDNFLEGNRRKPLAFSALAAFASVFVLAMDLQTLPLWCLFLLSSWIGFFGIGSYSLFIVEVAEASADDSVGVTISFALTLNQLAFIFAPPIFGFIADLKGYTWGWSGLAIILLLSGIGLWKNKNV
ncbi:MFS transporter [Hazenella coriacea]|uniref:Sugar phosphate permease n=1 Tax=Hazenella coriacea TaxID=1179467 RepID=A0A4R3L4K8_9BACL|nr:MFS transporter [Hazenella coriacea]TCS93875.1 sugar phosphate permease [Hazenella coriacea]